MYVIIFEIFRNTSKYEALDANNFAVFFLRVVCDASSKLILFGTWMLTYKCWTLSTTLIVAWYYGMVAVLVIVNIGFSLKEKEEIMSLRNLIGKNTPNISQVPITTLFMCFQESCLTASCQFWVSTILTFPWCWKKLGRKRSKNGCISPSSGDRLFTTSSHLRAFLGSMNIPK